MGPEFYNLYHSLDSKLCVDDVSFLTCVSLSWSPWPLYNLYIPRTGCSCEVSNSARSFMREQLLRRGVILDELMSTCLLTESRSGYLNFKGIGDIVSHVEKLAGAIATKIAKSRSMLVAIPEIA